MAKIMERGMLLPIGRDDQGNIRFATPEFVMGLMNSFKMPGQVYRGERKPTQEDALEFALNMAGLGQVTRFAGPLAKESGAVLAMNTPTTMKRYPESKGISALEIALRESKPEYKNAKFIFTGQGKDFADQLAYFDSPPKGSVYMAPDPQVADHYGFFENPAGRLVAFPVNKDFDISTIAKTDLPLNVPTLPKNQIVKRSPLGGTVYSNPDNKMMKDQFIFKEDDFMKLQPNVIGGKGLVLPSGIATSKSMMSDIAQRIRAGAKPFDNL